MRFYWPYAFIFNINTDNYPVLPFETAILGAKGLQPLSLAGSRKGTGSKYALAETKEKPAYDTANHRSFTYGFCPFRPFYNDRRKGG